MVLIVRRNAEPTTLHPCSVFSRKKGIPFMPAKKAAKKSAKYHDPKHDKAKDLRRAYEHLGRVEILQRTLHHADDVKALATLAHQELEGGHMKDAADLLRAAEHFSFAALAPESAEPDEVSDDLENALSEEFERLTMKAEEHWEHEEERHKLVATLYAGAIKHSRKALERGKYRQAMELIRVAEALAHVKKHDPDELQDGVETLMFSTS
jgi:hypothetical protein